MAGIKVADFAYPRMEAPDLDQMEEFLTHFGFVRAERTPDALYMRGADSHHHDDSGHAYDNSQYREHRAHHVHSQCISCYLDSVDRIHHFSHPVVQGSVGSALARHEAANIPGRPGFILGSYDVEFREVGGQATLRYQVRLVESGLHACLAVVVRCVQDDTTRSETCLECGNETGRKEVEYSH